jgi:hypothetical protein
LALFALSQPNARAAAVFGDELHTAFFEGPLNNFQSGSTGLARTTLQLVNGDGSDSRIASQILLAPTDKRAGGAALRGSEHPSEMH